MQIFKKNKKTTFDVNDNKTQCPRYSDGIENYMVETFRESSVRIGKVHAIGKRENQQDSFAYSDVANQEIVEEKGMLLLVADGMGGMSNGAEVSATVAIESLRYFDTHELTLDIPEYLENMAQYVNDQVNEFLGSDGIGRSGSTLVAMHIRDHEVHWISIGDSCIYLYRNKELMRLNVLHNYGTQLNEMLLNGEMTLEEVMAEPNKQALTSYIGAGSIALIDQNYEPLILNPGDRIMLMSDGIETVSEEELCGILRYDVEEAALKLRYLIEQKNKKNQDNFTAIIIEDNY
ncbi:MAG: protein phosphatase 2C domain-containing protein [Lachnospiraceae bacterium]